MAVTGRTINGIVAGDNGGIRREFTVAPTDLSLTFSKIYLTIKRRRQDLDAAAVLQKFITSSLTAAGHITKPSTGSDNLIKFYFLLTATESINLTPGKEYWYDIQGVTNTGEIYTFETESKIIAQQGETDATS